MRFFNIHHMDWLTYSGETDRPDELYHNFSISNNLAQIVNFPTWIPYCDWQYCSFGFIHFFWHQYLFYNGFPSIGKFCSCCCLSFHWLFNKLKTGSLLPLCGLWLSLCWLGWSLRYLRDVPLEEIFRVSASAAAGEFCEEFQVGIDVYIPHCKY